MANETSIDPSLTTILIIEEDELIRSVLRQQLETEGFKVAFAEGPNKAVEMAKSGSVSIVIADQEGKNISGLELLAKIKEAEPNVIRLLLTSSLSMKELCDAISSNLIHRFITKPWLREELLVIVRNSAACQLSARPIVSEERVEEESESAGEQSAEGAVAAPEGGAAGGMFTTVAEGDLAVEVFIKMIGNFHPNLGNTADRTRTLCRTIAEILDLPSEEAKALIWAGALHDVSLVSHDRGVVRRWLRGPEKCADEELALIKRHAKESEEIVKELPVFAKVGEIVRCHHENWDGSGYPDRLKGEMIPWLARLLAPAIFFCSKFQGGIQAMKDMEAQSDKMFDPTAVEVVGKAVPRTQLPRGVREILLIELQPGMVLAKDIYNTSGMCILAKSRELTPAWVNKINTINNTTPLEPLVLVYT